MKTTVRRTFLTGLFIALPLLVTFWVIRFVFGQLDRAVTPVVVRVIRLLGFGRWLEIAWLEYLAPLVSAAIALGLIYLLGLVGGNVLGRQFLKGIDRLLMQVPFVRGIYKATRQFLDTFSGSGAQAFSRVVLVEYPRQGVWSMAFLTNDTRGEVQALTTENMVSVFIPTTPNPTSGWLLFVPEKEVVPLSMSVDDAFKMIISGGILTPEWIPPDQQDRVSLLQTGEYLRPGSSPKPQRDRHKRNRQASTSATSATSASSATSSSSSDGGAADRATPTKPGDADEANAAQRPSADAGARRLW